MKKQVLLKTLLFMLGLACYGQLFAAVTFSGVSDSTAISGEPFTSQINALATGGTTITGYYKDFGSLSWLSINPTTGAITGTPPTASAGGRVEVYVTTATSGNFYMHFNVYVSDGVSCDPSLRAYWKLEETSGTTFTDYTMGETATTIDALSTVTGRVGNGRDFPGDAMNRKYLSVPDTGQFEWTVDDDFSYSVWIYAEGKLGWTAGYSGGLVDQILFCRRNGSDASRYNIIGLDGQTADLTTLYPKWKLATNGLEIKDVVTTTPIALNQWVMLTFVRDAVGGGDGYMKTYYNGNLVSNKRAFFNAGYSFEMDAAQTIGYLNYLGDDNYPFNGRMDEIIIYNKALSAAEITQMYTRGVAGEAHCDPGNMAPEIINNMPRHVNEDAAYTVNLVANDMDGDNVTIGAVSLPSWMELSGTTLRNKNGRPSQADVALGSQTIVLSLNDGHATVQRTFYVEVDNVNDAPVITSAAAPTTATEEVPYTHTFTWQDEDDLPGALTVTFTNNGNDWLSFNPTTGVLSGTPDDADFVTENATENFTVRLTITDDELPTHGSTYQDVTITVTKVDDPASISGSNSLITGAAQALVLTPAVVFDASDVTDVDSEFPTDYHIVILSGSNYTFSGNSVTPNADYNGDLAVSIQLVDVAATNYTLHINVTANQVPVVESTDVTVADDYELYNYVVEVSDPDGDAVEITEIAIPLWMSFEPLTATTVRLSGTPRWNQIGDTLVILGLNDGRVSSVIEHRFAITVGNTNTPPVLVTTPQVNFTTHDTLEYSLVYEDVDEDDVALTFIVDALPNWITPTAGDMGFKLEGIVPWQAQGTTQAIALRVSDGRDTIVTAYNLSIAPSALAEQTLHNLKVYPVPAQNQLFIECADLRSEASIQLLSLNGMILQQVQVAAGLNRVEFSIEGYKAGVYLYRIIENDRSTTGRFLVE